MAFIPDTVKQAKEFLDTFDENTAIYMEGPNGFLYSFTIEKEHVDMYGESLDVIVLIPFESKPPF